jgi:hypothetical protein
MNKKEEKIKEEKTKEKIKEEKIKEEDDDDDPLNLKLLGSVNNDDNDDNEDNENNEDEKEIEDNNIKYEFGVITKPIGNNDKILGKKLK